MAKIFVSFFNGLENPKDDQVLPCFYDGLVKTLFNSGNDVMCLSHDRWGEDMGKPPRRLLRDIKTFNPDLMIFFNNACYDLTPYFDNVPIVVYEADSCLYYSNKQVLKNNPDRFLYVTAQTSEVEEIEKMFGASKKNIFYLPFATAVKAEKKTLRTNIVFIGSHYKQSLLTKEFILSKPDEIGRADFRRVIEKLQKNPFLSKSEIISELKIKNQALVNAIDPQQLLHDISAVKRVQTLSAIADLGMNLYGPVSWTRVANVPELTMSYQFRRVHSLQDNQDTYNTSKIGININHAQANTGFSWRACDVMASNACLVTEEKPDFKRLFPKIRLPMFNNQFEAREQCLKLLRDEKLRLDLVQQCHQAIEENHSMQTLIDNLAKISGVPLINSGDGELAIVNIKREIWKVPSIQNRTIRHRLRMSKYSLVLLVNQIPLLNKICISQDEIVKRIDSIAAE